jgi:ribonuclease Y
MTHILFLQSFILPLIALAVGLGAGYGIYHIVLQKRGAAVLAKAEADGEVIMKEKILQAKEKFLQLKAENSQNFQEQR